MMTKPMTEPTPAFFPRLFFGLMAGLFSSQAPAMLFEDITVSAGITALNQADKPATGIAVADFDRNGLPDLYVTGYFVDNHLYLNQGGDVFALASYNSQVNPPSARCGSVAAADYDNDGWQDLYVACWGRNYLYRNQQGTGFSDVTFSAGVNHNDRSEAVAWGDLNADGLLDLIVAAYPASNMPDPNNPDNYDRIYFNNGDGTFTDIAHALDGSRLLQPTLALIIADIDLDGDPDIYVGNDKEVGNTLWRNDGPGCGGWCFTDIAPQTGAVRPAFTMGISLADADLDGDLEMAYTSVAEQILLEGRQAQEGLGYIDVSTPSGFNYNAVGWGTIFFDGDNDGWEDLFLAVEPLHPGNTSRLFRNDHDMTFADVTAGSQLGRDDIAMGVAWLDFNRDGRLDLAHGLLNVGYRLDRNITAATGHWLGFLLEGGGAINRDAIGTRIEITMLDGSKQMRELHAGESRGSNMDKLVHFGLGTATQVQEIKIRWPDGLEETLPSLPVDQYHFRVYPPVEEIFTGDFEV